MTNFKLFKLAIVVVVLCLISVWGLPSLASDNLSPISEKEIILQEDQQSEKKDQVKQKQEEDVGESMARRMSEGEDMFDIIGISDVMPTTLDLILLWIIPMSVIVAVIFIVIILSKRRHQRIMAMIEKGDFKEGELAKFQPKPYNWRLLTMLTGLVLVLGGVGFSLFKIGQDGIEFWYVGTIPLLIGAAFLIFNRIYYNNGNKE